MNNKMIQPIFFTFSLTEGNKVTGSEPLTSVVGGLLLCAGYFFLFHLLYLYPTAMHTAASEKV